MPRSDISNKPKTPKFVSIRRKLIRIAMLTGGIYVGIALLFFLFQTQLIFPAPRFPMGDWEAVDNTSWLEEVEFDSEDGCKLFGWLARSDRQRGVALISHGNGENIAFMKNELEMLSHRLGLTVFAYDYRGYGKSTGALSEAGILRDGRAAMRKLNQLTGTTPRETIVIGRSIGGGIACEIASSLGARALVLQSTFYSLENVAAEMYFWLPVRLLIKYKLRSYERIGRYDGPLIQSHGVDDSIVPISSAKKLFEACSSDLKVFVELPNAGHNDVFVDHYLNELELFINSLDEK